LFLNQLIFGTLIIIITVVFHIACLVMLVSILRKMNNKKNNHISNQAICVTIIIAVFVIIAIHTIEVWLWAAIYLYLGEFTDFSQSLYFSAVTSTTLGYGDLTLSHNWQILGTFESMGGLILFGTSTAFLIGLMEKLFFNKNNK
jgi:hypothetical protein